MTQHRHRIKGYEGIFYDRTQPCFKTLQLPWVQLLNKVSKTLVLVKN